jgi:general secretion pathway protein K
MREPLEHKEKSEESSNRAFILVSVIWITGLLAVIATAFAINIRVQILSGANTAQNAKAEFISDGLVYLTAWKLTAEDDDDKSIPRNGAPWACRWSEDADALIAVQDQGGLIDLNAASAKLLSQLFQQAGLQENRAGELAAAIEDFRDSDNDAAEGVFEPETYDGKTYGPKNAPFNAVEEIDQLPGMTDQLYYALLPVLTVHSLQPGFDPALTPAGLRQILGIKANDQVPSELAPFAAPSQGNIFGVDVSITLKNGTAFRRHAIIAVTRQPDRPFAILAWQRGSALMTGQGAAVKQSCFN